MTDTNGRGGTNGRAHKGAAGIEHRDASKKANAKEAKLDAIVADAVEKAFTNAEEEAKWEAGSAYGRTVAPLLLGPQRYRDPDIYAPPAEARPVIGGEGSDATKKVPLTKDPRYEQVLELMDELDARTGWPGGPG